MTNLIPRKTLFGNPHRVAVKISPDGNQLSYLAPDEGVMNVWVAPLEQKENARVVTHDRSTGIAHYFWSFDGQRILYLQDKNGDEDFHLYSVDLATGKEIDLTPFEKISAQITHYSHRHPHEMLVGINDRDQHWFHDIYRIDIRTGERELVELNNQFIGFVADDELRVRLAITMTPESDMVFLTRVEPADEWEHFQTIDSSEILTTSPISFDKSGDSLFMLDSRNRDKAAIVSIELDSQSQELVYANEKADVSAVLTHPTENIIQAVTFTFDRVEHAILDESIKPDFEYLATVCDGELDVVSQTLDLENWIVAYSTDDGPVRYYHYNRSSRRADFLFSHRPELETLDLAKMQSHVIKSRDQLDLVSYLTLPTTYSAENAPDAPPMVLLVHGGPWHRDYWGYNPLHQLLANRGYAVLSVNFRGSTGLGKSFINAADKEWAGKMHDDLIDAVNWAVEQGFADRSKIAIMGGSYGGYAALVGLTFTPEVFACGIDIVGPSNLITLMENPPPYWMPIMPLMTTRVGDYSSAAGREFLESRSPLFHVENIQRPLLIGQGANDPRVKQAESDQIVAAMQRKDIPVTYVLYPEEGHGFDRPENDISFYAICEAFLAEHLGGSSEQVGADFEGANFEIKSGKDIVSGLEKT